MKVFARKMIGITVVAAVAMAASGCTAIRDSRGYIVDPVLFGSVQPGIDNQRSVEGTLGRPTFTSQYGEPTWYYVSSATATRPLSAPRIREHTVLAVRFDQAGNVVAAERSGIEQVVFLSPDDDETPTLGRERGFLEDLFGNIGQVGGVGPPGATGPSQP